MPHYVELQVGENLFFKKKCTLTYDFFFAGLLVQPFLSFPHSLFCVHTKKCTGCYKKYVCGRCWDSSFAHAPSVKKAELSKEKKICSLLFFFNGHPVDSVLFRKGRSGGRGSRKRLVMKKVSLVSLG